MLFSAYRASAASGSRWASRLLCVVVLAGVAATSGCVKWRIGTIRPSELPENLRPQASREIRTLQLAMLGRPVQADHRIEPGDLLDITVSDLFEENRTHTFPARVRDDGTALLPMVGPVGIGTLSVSESEQVVCASYWSGGLLQKPQVMVTLRQQRQTRVFVVGAVNKPGMYDLNRSEADLLSAVVAAGGLTEDANTVIEIRRRVVGSDERQDDGRSEVELATTRSQGTHEGKGGGGSGDAGPGRPAAGSARAASGSRGDAGGSSAGGQSVQAEAAASSVIRLDLADSRDQGWLARGVGLQNGDIVSIDRRKAKTIYVIGGVTKAGRYEVPADRDIRVLEAIAMAGGVDSSSLPCRAVVIRQNPQANALAAVRVNLNRAKKDLDENVLLAAGDTVSVEETFLSYMRGMLRGAFRIGVGADVRPGGF